MTHGSISVNTPIGTFGLYDYQYLHFHRTYVQLIDEKNGEKLVFELSQRAMDQFEANTSGKAKITVEERANSTIVSIQSRSITNYLCKKRDPQMKPNFPDTIIPHWVILNNFNVDWGINNFGDFVVDCIFVLLWLIFCFFDLCLIFIDLTLRLVAFIFIILWYVICSFWR